MSETDQAFKTAMAQRGQGRMDEALGVLQEALKDDPDSPRLLHALGGMLVETGRADEGLVHLNRAAGIEPDNPLYHKALGDACIGAGDLDGAERAFRRALEVSPGYGLAAVGLANLQIGRDNYPEAERIYEQALTARPGQNPDPMVICGLAKAMLVTGRAGAAAELLRNGVRAWPGSPDIRAALCMTLNYADNVDPNAVVLEHVRLGQMAKAMFSIEPMEVANDPDPERPLKVGYLSPDFRTHSVAFFVESLLRCHDRERFEIYCYASFIGGHKPDETTDRLRALADHWRHVDVVSDPALAQMIRDDGIDLLVDLSGLTSGCRLMALHLKPAPVLVGFIGYPNISGIPTMDYRIVDEVTDPRDRPNMGGERLVRVPDCFLCYTPPPDAPEAGTPPCAERGEVTFGSFNIAMKITPTTCRMWANALLQVPLSRLILKSRGFANAVTRERCRERFAKRGLGEDRVELLAMTPSVAEHLDLYRRIDVALDTWPYNGTTTSCEAMWMGVPVVTRRGVAHASRVGASLLHAVGLDELVARNEEDFVRIAADLGSDEDRLAGLRSGLRSRMAQSPLCDGTGHARRIEGAYREMWRNWCSPRLAAGRGG